MSEIYKKLKEFGSVRTNASLTHFCTFKIGGPADYLVSVTRRESLVGLLQFLTDEGVDWFILGGGANVLFPDGGFRGVVIRLLLNKISVQQVDGGPANERLVFVEAGTTLTETVRFCVQKGLAGFEWAAGIPGTIGGAVRGNAGAHYSFAGGEIKDFLLSASVWQDGETVEFTNADCAFAYRDSFFKHYPAIILGASFNLVVGDQREILAITQRIVEERRGKHAAEPSAGSFFKNVPLEKWKADRSLLPPRFLEYQKIAAGWLVEQCGLKGLTRGGAMVSKSHGNFIINVGGATQADVLAVVDEVTSRVYTRFGIELEPEVQIVR